MKYYFRNTFFFIESTAIDNTTDCYLIDFGIQKRYQHRYYEWKHCHKTNIFHDAYDKLADILVDAGYRVDIDDNWLRIFCNDEVSGFNDVKQIVKKNIDWLVNYFDV